MSGLRACRSCGSAELTPFLSLGAQPLANDFIEPGRAGSPQETFPLDAVFCRACSLVQIVTTVLPERLFREYVYFSSVAQTTLDNGRRLAERVLAGPGLGADSLVMEIASNDGYLLKHLVAAGIPVLGIEPATNIARAAVEKGIPTLNEFFGAKLAEDLAASGKRADFILANNVMAHMPDLNGAVEGVRLLLKPGGTFLFQTPYVRDMIEKLEFDTIFHEHVYVHSLTALQNVLRRHGLEAREADRIAIHGGSLEVTAGLIGSGPVGESVRRLLEEEQEQGLTREAYYLDFAERVRRLGESLRAKLDSLRAEGKRIAAYGAPAKGVTLLNSLGIGRDRIDFVVDLNPRKQGMLMPGSAIPIHPPAKLLEARPDYVLLLAWNLASEILAQQAEYRNLGGRFIVPIPEVKIV